MNLTLLDSFNEIIDQYDLFLFDLWGTLHNGKQLFSETIPCLKILKQKKKLVFLLSNSPRLDLSIQKKLEEIGLLSTLYQGIYTAGDDCYINLKNKTKPFFSSLKEKFYHVGPSVYLSAFQELGFRSVSNIQKADFVLATGMVEETLEDYDTLLEDCLDLSLPLVCANADTYVMYGQQKALCIGSVAKNYQQRGGLVYIHGKPCLEMFENVHQLAENYIHQTIDKKKTIMIGDFLSTDIKGANAYGIDSLMVLTGVHEADFAPYWKNKKHLEKNLKSIIERHQSPPTYIGRNLS